MLLEHDGAHVRQVHDLVDDGRGPRSVELTTAFDSGAWIHVDIDVTAGGSVLISLFGLLVSAALFIFGLKGLTKVKTARRGNMISAIGMLLLLLGYHLVLPLAF